MTRMLTNIGRVDRTSFPAMCTVLPAVTYYHMLTIRLVLFAGSIPSLFLIRRKFLFYSYLTMNTAAADLSLLATNDIATHYIAVDFLGILD